MRFGLVGLLATLVFSPLVAAHSILLKKHSQECFHEDLHTDDRMTVTFQVGDREMGSNGNLDIVFWILNPQKQYQVQPTTVSSGTYEFTAPLDGRYVYCFSNDRWASTTKEVSFNIHGVVYVPESEFQQDPVEKEVREILNLVSQVRAEQSYIVAREQTHRNTAESTNSRVMWWSIFQLVVLVAQGGFQVWWLRRFFEVKRNV